MTRSASVDAAMLRYSLTHRPSELAAHAHHQNLHSGEQNQTLPDQKKFEAGNEVDVERDSIESEKERLAETGFRQQIAAFLILEFGVLFHSVIIGLTLGTAGDEFATLYPVSKPSQGPVLLNRTLT